MSSSRRKNGMANRVNNWCFCLTVKYYPSYATSNRYFGYFHRHLNYLQRSLTIPVCYITDSRFYPWSGTTLSNGPHRWSCYGNIGSASDHSLRDCNNHRNYSFPTCHIPFAWGDIKRCRRKANLIYQTTASFRCCSCERGKRRSISRLYHVSHQNGCGGKTNRFH